MSKYRGVHRDERHREEMEEIHREILCTQAIELWGVEAQHFVALEELAELQQAVVHRLRGRVDDKALAEEIADVRVMLRQLEVMYGLGDVPREFERAKFRRLERRIAKDLEEREEDSE